MEEESDFDFELSIALQEMSEEGVLEQFIDMDGNFVWAETGKEPVYIEGYEVVPAKEFLDDERFWEWTIVKVYFTDSVIIYATQKTAELLYTNEYDTQKFEDYVPRLDEESGVFFYVDHEGLKRLEGLQRTKG